jgi:dihydroorotase
VEKMSHNVAEIYRIKERGYIREGYFADLVLVDLNKKQEVTASSLLYKCKWSPFLKQVFKSSINSTFVNGNLVYEKGLVQTGFKGKRLKFEKIR